MVQARGGPHAPQSGTVEEFDDPRGLGVIAGDDGRRYPFHCTAIADGSRHVAVGTRVVFSAGAGHLGRLEARAVTDAQRPLP
jgi:CspA family cold shock protein